MQPDYAPLTEVEAALARNIANAIVTKLRAEAEPIGPQIVMLHSWRMKVTIDYGREAA